MRFYYFNPHLRAGVRGGWTTAIAYALVMMFWFCIWLSVMLFVVTIKAGVFMASGLAGLIEGWKEKNERAASTDR